MGLTSSKPPPDNGVYYMIVIIILLIFIQNLKEKIEKEEKNVKTIVKSEFDKIIGLEYEKKNHDVINNVGKLTTDFVISSADYYHTETLLPKELRNYNEEYWSTRELCPSTLIFHLSLKK